MKALKNPLTPLQLRGYCLEHMKSFARQIMDKPTADPPPQMLLIYLPPNTAHSHAQFHNPENWQTDLLVFANFDDARYQQMQQIGKEYATHGHTILCACLATLAWMAKYEGDPTTGKNNRPAIMPRDHPQRQEVAICWAQTLTNQQHAVTIPIYRDANGAATPGQQSERTSQKAALLDHFFQAYATAFLEYVGQKSPTAASHPLARVHLN